MGSELPKTAPESVFDLPREQRLELALSLLRRHQRGEDAEAALTAKYPSVPGEMIRTAVHHVYVDGPDAVISFLADAELAIRFSEYEIGYGTTSELLYHVYNWLQFRAILPEGKADLLELLSQLEQAVQDDDRELIRATAKELREIVDGNRSAPDMDT
jgi:hypothetical protein